MAKTNLEERLTNSIVVTDSLTLWMGHFEKKKKKEHKRKPNKEVADAVVFRKNNKIFIDMISLVIFEHQDV